MEYTTLGRTGLKVSVAGLGCGGFSQLGLGTGKTEAEAIGIIHAALDAGINIFDTAAAYGTEPVLGRALQSVPREQVVICTKAPFGISNSQSDPQRALDSLDRSRHRLHRCLPAARGRAARLRPYARGHRAGAAAGEGEG
jgi:aryl-alcohol dehydrogenase-like predicted oxidoreductase